jgi:Holliday junction DNA helicase RuvA
MIAYIKGEVLTKLENSAVIVAGGVGYEICITQSALDALRPGATTEFFIKESLSPYDGTTLYGFRTVQERELFELFRDAIPNTGAKKALELLNKALKSLPDFHQAITTRDARLLTGIFGFTAKTAEKLIVSLKDKMGAAPGGAKIATQGLPKDSAILQLFEAMSALGYSAMEAKKTVEAIQLEGVSPEENVEALLRRALKKTAI